MKEKVNIICLYWVGSFRGRDFTTRDIDRLFLSVKKHIDREFDFYILTNDKGLIKNPDMYYVGEDQLNIIPLEHNWPGWWSKMELHRPDLPEGRTLYMDLDSHAIRSLQPILDYEGDLVMFPTGIPQKKWSRLRKEKWVCRYQAATMLFDSGCLTMRKIWSEFISNPEKYMNAYRSDQDIMGEFIPNQPMFPREWMCKLDTIRDYKEPPEDVIIVTGQTRDGLFRNTNSISWFEKMARG